MKTGTEFLFKTSWPKIRPLSEWQEENPHPLNKSSRQLEMDEDLRKMEEAKRNGTWLPSP